MTENPNNSEAFISAAHVTLSEQFHGHIVPKLLLREALNESIAALTKLDRIKKALFYGRAIPTEELQAFASHAAQDCSHIAVAFTDRIGYAPAVNLLHGIIGKATESAELLEAVYNCLFNGSPLDLTNVKEEVGDGFWYDAIILRAIGSDFEDAQARVIAKLRKRYPGKFEAHAAINRDIAAERAALENPEGN